MTSTLPVELVNSEGECFSNENAWQDVYVIFVTRVVVIDDPHSVSGHNLFGL